MDVFSSVNAENLFSYINQRQNSLENLARQSLSKGIDRYMEKNYSEAVKEFKRSVGLSFNSPLSADASNYLAITYLKLNDTKNAIKTYEQSINLNPQRDDIRITLGNLYYSEERYDDDAVSQFQQAIDIKDDFYNAYSELGYAYADSGEMEKAQEMVDFLED